MAKRIAEGPGSSEKAIPASVASDFDDIYFSYAHPSDPWPRRLAIRAVEKLTGAPILESKYRENRHAPRPGESFFEACVRHLELKIRYNTASLEAAPRDRALVVIANHPYGVLDGVVISYLMEKVRPDFKVMANSLLYRAEEPRPFIVPVDLTQDRSATETNLQSRALASDHLRDGNTLVIFPGAGISTAHRTFGPAHDLPWKPFTGKLIQLHQVDVLPMFFEGQNSPLFQLVSRYSMAFRQALLFHEVVRRIGSEVVVNIGDIIPYERIASIRDRAELLRYLRRETYSLGGRFSPNDPDDHNPDETLIRRPTSNQTTISEWATAR
ncbi:MAG: lysophospholipid acyltransferase family protein [Pseudomonadota bacterium]